MIIQKSLAIALAMLFGATSGMTEPDAAKPKLSDIESWTCRTRVDLDMHFNAKIELVVRNPEDRYNTDLSLSDVERPHFYVYRQNSPQHAALTAMMWGPLDLEAPQLGPPNRLEFGVERPRMKEGIVHFSAAGGDITMQLNKMNAHWLNGFDVTWLTITDAAILRALAAADGWSITHHTGKRVSDRGLVRIPRWTAIQSAYRTVRIEMENKLKNPADACDAKLIDWNAREMGEI